MKINRASALRMERALDERAVAEVVDEAHFSQTDSCSNLVSLRDRGCEQPRPPDWPALARIGGWPRLLATEAPQAEEVTIGLRQGFRQRPRQSESSLLRRPLSVAVRCPTRSKCCRLPCPVPALVPCPVPCSVPREPRTNNSSHLGRQSLRKARINEPSQELLARRTFPKPTASLLKPRITAQTSYHCSNLVSLRDRGCEQPRPPD